MDNQMYGCLMSYNGWELSEASRAELLRRFTPTYPDVIAHHVTARFGARESDPLPSQQGGYVVGIADNGEGVEALVLDMGQGIDRPDGFVYHCTWSIDRARGCKPQHAKEASRDFAKPIDPSIWVEGLTPKFFR